MVKREATTEDQLEQLASLFRLLSDRTRLNLLMLLADGERNVTNLCETLRLPQPTVSHHLGLLRMSNVIANRRDGKQVFYSLDGRVNLSDSGAIDIATPDFQVRIAPRDGRALPTAAAAAVVATAGASNAHAVAGSGQVH
jgi:DNA-binding transcriptional ArsR family regulator